MPNHVSNRLTIEGDSGLVVTIMHEIRGTEINQFIDFNRIIPMPDVLKDTGSGSTIIEGQRLSTWWTDNEHARNDPQRRPDRLLTEEEQALIAATGFNNWYDWSVAKWGTKWNAYSQSRVDEKSIRLNTAWNAPVPVISELAARYPEARFTMEYADEDKGSNAGIYVFEYGELASATTLGHRRACALWFEMNGADPMDYGYDPVTFAYLEEDEAA